MCVRKKISPADYQQILRKVSMVFQGRNEELQDLLQQQMVRYSERLDFEAAARVRDQLQGLSCSRLIKKWRSPMLGSAVMCCSGRR